MVRKAISGLNENIRTALAKFHLEGKSYQEIAAEMAFPSAPWQHGLHVDARRCRASGQARDEQARQIMKMTICFRRDRLGKGRRREDHLSEIVLTAIADGQADIVPEVVFSHLQWCESCVSSIGESAMLSARIGGAWHEVGLAVVKAKEPRAIVVPAPLPVPWFAVAAALVVAILSALPQLAIAPCGFTRATAP